MESSDDFPLRLHLHGRFRVETNATVELTPISSKAQGLLALLATEPNMTRQRRWLQDKLWSSSDPKRGSGSLRSEIVKIRSALGPFQDVLIANKLTLGLDASRVVVVDDLPDQDGDFLEGIDIDDPEFEDWLALKRSGMPRADVKVHGIQLTQPIVTPENEIVVVTTTDREGPMHRHEINFADIVSRSIRELFSFSARYGREDDASQGTLRLQIGAADSGDGKLGIRVAVDRIASASPPWAETAFGAYPKNTTIMSPEHLGLSHRTTIALIDLLARGKSSAGAPLSASVLAGNALSKMFTMRREHFVEADQLLLDAYDQEPRGLYQAWRAQLAVIRFVEAGFDAALARDMSEEFCAHAMADEPMNSNVLAAVANARLVFEQDGAAARELSMLSVKMNPANPFAWTSWTNALLYTGEPEKALSAAKTSQSLAKDGKFRFWADFYVALTSLATGQHDSAIAYSERARALNPSFRPPLRYLIGLFACSGDEEKARQAAGRLERIEPEFSLDRMINDQKYPVSMMRQSGLIVPARLRDL